MTSHAPADASALAGPRDYADGMAIARLIGGPLDDQVVPLDDDTDDTLIVPYGEGQLVYRREGGLSHTGNDDGPTEARFVFGEGTADIDPNAEGRLD